LSFQILQELGKAFEDLCEQYLGRAITPVRMMPPVYGTYDTKWTNFLAPGVITVRRWCCLLSSCSRSYFWFFPLKSKVISFAQSISVTAMSFIKERTNGCMDRIYAAGVPATVLISANFVTHSVILVIQVSIMLIVSIFVFHIQVVGNLFYVFTLLLTLGIVGQSFGMFVSAVVREESEAIQMTLAIFFPALLLSGVIWPIEAIPSWFVWVSKGLPTTWTAAAMRSVMLRGWGIDQQSVWLGYVCNAAWTIFFLSIAAFLLSSVGMLPISHGISEYPLIFSGQNFRASVFVKASARRCRALTSGIKCKMQPFIQFETRNRALFGSLPITQKNQIKMILIQAIVDLATQSQL
jgi:ABC-type polysaccharide/polyol phosphate export permease